jgi:hypothetical protein
LFRILQRQRKLATGFREKLMKGSFKKQAGIIAIIAWVRNGKKYFSEKSKEANT